MIKSFFCALQFLTIVPVKLVSIDERKISNSLIFFPFVSALMGLLLAGFHNLLIFFNFETLPASIIVIVLSAALTGGIHLDGLADTADAFLSGKKRGDMLNIMRDSHIGVMGVLSLICILLLKIAFFSSINPSLKPVSLVLMLTLSRWSLVFTMFLFPYARNEGKAKTMIQGNNLKILSMSTAIAFLCAFCFWRLNGLIVFAAAAAGAYAAGKFINKKIGGITGDTLGAISELVEAAVLLFIVILGKIMAA